MRLFHNIVNWQDLKSVLEHHCGGERSMESWLRGCEWSRCVSTLGRLIGFFKEETFHIMSGQDLSETLGFGSKVLTMMRKTSKAKSHSWPPPLPGRRRSANMEYAEWAPSTGPTTTPSQDPTGIRYSPATRHIFRYPTWPGSVLEIIGYRVTWIITRNFGYTWHLR